LKITVVGLGKIGLPLAVRPRVRRALTRYSSSACCSGPCWSRWSPSWWCLGGRPTPTPRAVSGRGPPPQTPRARDNLPALSHPNL